MRERKSLFRRVYDRMIEARERDARRVVAEHLERLRPGPGLPD